MYYAMTLNKYEKRLLYYAQWNKIKLSYKGDRKKKFGS